MTNTEIKRIYKNHLKDVLPSGFILKGGILYNKDINELLVGFCFEKSGFHKDGVYVWSFVMPLYVEKEDLSLTFGKRMEIKKNGGVWRLKNNSDIDKTISELKSLMKKELKAFLSKIKTSEDFYDYFKNKKVKNIRIKEALVYSAIHSDNKKGKKLISEFIKELQKEDLEIGWIKSILEAMVYLEKEYENKNDLNVFFNKNIEQTKLNLKL
ncbi:hypothetical protein F7018_17170 [Tenacibaculum aiptasiae]|uniref:DUF4304 domain-containing protein n=1 Tax=Tenacibaculum aiptasiae TaxID=426481 RepID=A0A7J5A777_9FLAO|nr:hypothetical protein [Tenacibaculum aiptasiae]KAB1153395.1 hypothetical protein F7018_17170 [Tenacibaculum aiptasiae]